MARAVVLGVFAVSGAVSALAFPPFDVPWALWAALAPALVAAVSTSPRMAALGGLVYGFVFVEMLLGWFFGLFGWAAVALHLVLASFYALIFAGAHAAVARWGRHALLWAAPVFWVGVEFFRSECWWLKFSWFGLGYSQHANVELLQSASVVGVYGLSLVIAASNGAIAWFLLDPRGKRLLAPAAAALAIGAMHAGGCAVAGSHAAGTEHVVGVEGEQRPIKHFLDRSRDALDAHPNAKLIVWPELAVEDVTESNAVGTRVGAFARDRGVYVLVGGVRGSDPVAFENTIFLFAPDGRIAASQVKSVPVQFFLDGRPATDRAPMRAGDLTLGAAICYDMDFPYVTRELVVEGADVLVYPTLDHRNWGRVQHLQHASMTPLRAVEHRRWLVRVASSGGSRVIGPYGRVVASTPVMTDGTIAGAVEPRSDLTVYTRYGYWLPHLCLAFAGVMLVLCRKRPTLPS